MRQHVLAAKADCKVMSGGSVESLATYTEAYGPQLHDWPVSLSLHLLVTAAALATLRGDARRASRSLAVERNSIWTRSQGPWVLFLHVRDRVRRILTRDEVRHCKAQAASLTVDTALAAELGDAWPLER